MSNVPRSSILKTFGTLVERLFLDWQHSALDKHYNKWGSSILGLMKHG
jgi:hypothetical protein